MSKDACCHGDYTAHVTEDAKTITHTGGSVEVFQLSVQTSAITSGVCQADEKNKTFMTSNQILLFF